MGRYMNTREEQKEKRRQEILAAGLDLFIRKGYGAAKVSDIAREVGMSVGLLFHYFESKEKLLESLVDIGIEGPMSVMSASALEPLEFFRITADTVLNLIKTEPFSAKMFVFMGQIAYNEAVSPAIRAKLASFDILTPTVAIIERGQRGGTIRAGNPLALAITWWSAIQGIALQIALAPEMPCPESEWILDMLRRKNP